MAGKREFWMESLPLVGSDAPAAAIPGTRLTSMNAVCASPNVHSAQSSMHVTLKKGCEGRILLEKCLSLLMRIAGKAPSKQPTRKRQKRSAACIRNADQHDDSDPSAAAADEAEDSDFA